MREFQLDRAWGQKLQPSTFLSTHSVRKLGSRIDDVAEGLAAFKAALATRTNNDVNPKEYANRHNNISTANSGTDQTAQGPFQSTGKSRPGDLIKSFDKMLVDFNALVGRKRNEVNGMTP